MCGYANAHGGTLFIGKNDDGKVVGIQGSKKLLEDLPNKITNALGIIADVNLRTEDGKDYLEIVVDKYPSLITITGGITIVPAAFSGRLSAKSWNERC